MISRASHAQEPQGVGVPCRFHQQVRGQVEHGKHAPGLNVEAEITTHRIGGVLRKIMEGEDTRGHICSCLDSDSTVSIYQNWPRCSCCL